MATLRTLEALEVLDSRGNPTLQVTAMLHDGSTGTASVPSGASTGTHEALELRDGNADRYGGKGVLRALQHVEGVITESLKGKDVSDQRTVDKFLIDLDGTPNKSKLGANAILGTSLAIAHARAKATGQELWQSIAAQFGYTSAGKRFPTPMCNVINGGVHADSGLSFQEFMVLPQQKDFPERIRCGVEVFHALGAVIKGRAFSTLVGDEGGYAPRLRSNGEPLVLISEAVANAGYDLGKDVLLGMDAAASEFAKPDGTYPLALEAKGSHGRPAHGAVPGVAPEVPPRLRRRWPG
jgi:enolase